MTQKHMFPKNMSSLVNYITKTGTIVESDRGTTVEILNANLVLQNVRDRLDTTRRRKMNIAFAFAEFISLLSGIDEIGYFTKFIKNYAVFSSDGAHLDGAYGKRLMVKSVSAIEDIVNLLGKNPQSRRAYLPIYTLTDLTEGTGGLNTPCTIGIHFLIRDAKLISIVTMRSNDVYYGLTNDIVVFTMLQEYVADRLGLECGPYYHNASSLHYYVENHEKFVALPEGEARWPWLMGEMNGALNDPTERKNLINAFNVLRVDNEEAFALTFELLDSQYARNMAAAAASFIFRKSDLLLAKKYYNFINDITLRRVCYQWLKSSPKDGV